MRVKISPSWFVLAISMLSCNLAEYTPDLAAVQSLIQDAHYDSALVALEGVLERGAVKPMSLVLDKDIDQLIQLPEYRPKIRTLIKTYAREDSAIIKGEEEPGQRITVHGVLSDERTDQPLQGVLVELVQTDAKGKYFEEKSPWNPRLFAYLKTNTAGEFTIETILPGKYRDEEGEWVPVHVHFTLEKEGYRTYASEFSFETDSTLQRNGNIDRVPVAKLIQKDEYRVLIQMQPAE